MPEETITQNETGEETKKQPVLSLNNIEVIYDDVILVLKGMSLDVYDGQIGGCGSTSRDKTDSQSCPYSMRHTMCTSQYKSHLVA